MPRSIVKDSIRSKKSSLKVDKLGDSVQHHEGLGYLPILRIRKEAQRKQSKTIITDSVIEVTPSTSTSTEEFINNLNISYFKRDSVKSSKSSSTIGSSVSHLTETEIESGDEQLFPTLFRSIPKLSDISELGTSTDEEFKPSIANKESLGYFTKPIDSDITLKQSIGDVFPSNEYEDIEESVYDIPTDDSSQYFTPSLESVTQVQPDKIDLKDAEEDELLYNLLNQKIKGVVEMEEKTLIDQVTADSVELFLTKLIDSVVNKCENVGRKPEMPLDKRKMMEKLIKLSNQYKLVKYINDYLNHCVVEKYKKSRIYYTIIPSKYDGQYQERYKNSLNLMDFTIQRRKDVVDICRANVECLQLEEEGARGEVENSVSQLEEFIKETLLKRQEFRNMNEIVADQLRRMAAVRNEITNVRTELLIKQHEVQVIKDKLENIKYITNDLTVHEYLNVQADVQSLSQKNEECSAEVARLCIKSKRDIHWLAHIRYKNQMLNGNLQSARELFEKKRNEEVVAHRTLFYATLEHDRLKKEISDVRYEGGLLHYPVLMEDYRKVEKSISEKEVRIDDLIIKHNYLIWRIRKLMIKYGIEDPEMSHYPSLRNSRISRISRTSSLSREASKSGFGEVIRKRPASLKGITKSISPSSLGILKRRKLLTKKKKTIEF